MKIKEVKRDDQKVSIILENDFCLEVLVSDYITMNLYEKEEFSQEECERIKLITETKMARIDALKFLSYKIRSSREVFLKLQTLNYTDEAIENAITGLIADKYIDDMDYAQRYARTKIKLKKISKKQLEFELLQKGISEEIINTLDDLADIDEYTDIKNILAKKYNINDLKDNKIRLKAMKYLYSKRYSTELIQGILEDLLRDI